ncbi:hypothetical protein ABKV19_019842 [Rosa sericea]
MAEKTMLSLLHLSCPTPVYLLRTTCLLRSTERLRSKVAQVGTAACSVPDSNQRRPVGMKSRSVFRSKTPPTNSSRRKRRAQRKRARFQSQWLLLTLIVKKLQKKSEKDKVEPEIVVVNEEKKTGEDEKKGERSGASCSSSNLPCMDKLRDELS